MKYRCGSIEYKRFILENYTRVDGPVVVTNLFVMKELSPVSAARSSDEHVPSQTRYPVSTSVNLSLKLKIKMENPGEERWFLRLLSVFPPHSSAADPTSALGQLHGTL